MQNSVGPVDTNDNLWFGRTFDRITPEIALGAYRITKLKPIAKQTQIDGCGCPVMAVHQATGRPCCSPKTKGFEATKSVFGLGREIGLEYEYVLSFVAGFDDQPTLPDTRANLGYADGVAVRKAVLPTG